MRRFDAGLVTSTSGAPLHVQPATPGCWAVLRTVAGVFAVAILAAVTLHGMASAPVHVALDDTHRDLLPVAAVTPDLKQSPLLAPWMSRVEATRPVWVAEQADEQQTIDDATPRDAGGSADGGAGSGGGLDYQPPLFSSKAVHKPRGYARVTSAPVGGYDWAQAYLNVPPADNTHPELNNPGLLVLDAMEDDSQRLETGEVVDDTSRSSARIESPGADMEPIRLVQKPGVDSVVAQITREPIVAPLLQPATAPAQSGALHAQYDDTKQALAWNGTSPTKANYELRTGMAEREKTGKPLTESAKPLWIGATKPDSSVTRRPIKLEPMTDQPVATAKPIVSQRPDRPVIDQPIVVEQINTRPVAVKPAVIKPAPNHGVNPKVLIPERRDVVVHIDRSNERGFGGDKVHRIQDAIETINRVSGDVGLNLQLTTVSRPAAQADLNLQVASDLDTGVLGYADAREDRFGGVVTISDQFDWYTGADASRIGRSQFDLQSVVTHELLHLLGLEDRYDTSDHAADLKPAMHFSLNSGQVRRALNNEDTHLLAEAVRHGLPVSHSGALTAIPEPATLGLLVVGGFLLRKRPD